MQWDLGYQGIGLLILISVIFGVLAHLALARRTTAWMGVIASAAYFVGGLIASEWWFGWATEASCSRTSTAYRLTRRSSSACSSR